MRLYTPRILSFFSCAVPLPCGGGGAAALLRVGKGDRCRHGRTGDRRRSHGQGYLQGNRNRYGGPLAPRQPCRGGLYVRRQFHLLQEHRGVVQGSRRCGGGGCPPRKRFGRGRRGGREGPYAERHRDSHARNDKGRSAGHEWCFGGPDIEKPRPERFGSRPSRPRHHHHRRPFHHRARPVAALQQRMDKRTGRPEYRDRQPCLLFRHDSQQSD